MAVGASFGVELDEPDLVGLHGLEQEAVVEHVDLLVLVVQPQLLILRRKFKSFNNNTNENMKCYGENVTIFFLAFSED